MEKVCLNFNTPEQIGLDRVSVKTMQKYLSSGHFGTGSMAPKVEAAIEFARTHGKKAIITSLDKALDALEGRTGTHIHMDGQYDEIETDVSFEKNNVFILG